ncbi:MAG TPA: FtsX-like permease family protein, partial [Gemmataceae bacterium]|nr:FtsX-like permease family protein [Gemmataceae bacterium]
MTFGRLLLRNLVFHRRGNFAVFLGVVVGAAVLTGALLVGDSLRGSLRERALRQLGWVDHALIAGRFFREEVADQLPPERVSPAIFLQGAASRIEGSGGRVNKVVIVGVDESFWPETPPAGEEFWRPKGYIPEKERAVVLGATLARDLNVKKGERVALHLEKVSAAPRETFLGKRKAEDVLATLEVAVAEVLAEDDFGSEFSLNPSPAAPRNAYLPLALLQQELRRSDDAARSLPKKPINALLARGGTRDTLQAALGKQLRLEDWGLEVRVPRKLFGDTPPRYLSLESKQMFVEPAALKAVEATKLGAAPTLVYMVNNVATLRHHVGAAVAAVTPPSSPPVAWAGLAYYAAIEAPYCIVAALDPTKAAPLGPFLPPDKSALADNEILLVAWQGSPFLKAPPGEKIALTYFKPGEEGRLPEVTTILQLAGTAPLTGPFRDRNLTPKFPGVTDAPTMADWKEKAPFPFDELRVGATEKDYWSAHQATPKAYVTLKTGQRLWGSRFGQVTSVRLAATSGEKEKTEEQILAHLQPEQGGFLFDDVRRQRLEGSAGAMDFGMLFLGFSCFLIAAALLLVGLLFRLNLDRRASEIGVLLATGWRRGKVRWLLLAEGGILAVLGGLVGLVGAIVYAWLMLGFLSARWPGGLGRSLLQLHVTPASLAIGYLAAVVVSLLTIVWATRILGRVAPRALLLGETAEAASGPQRKLRWSKWLFVVGLVGAPICFVVGTRV